MALDDESGDQVLQPDSHFAYLSQEYAAKHAGHNCPLEDVSYYARLYSAAVECITQCSAPTSRPTSTVALLYTRMMCENCFSSGVGDLYDLHEVSASIAEKGWQNAKLTSSATNRHFVLWCAVHCYFDVELLGERLGIEECIASTSLLPLSAYLLNDDAVELLIKNGAKPNKIDSIFYTLRYLPFDKILTQSTPQLCWIKKLSNTLKLLLDNGASLTPDSSKNNPSIFFAVTLASHGLVEAVDHLMAAATDFDLNFCPEESSFNGYQPQTVLSLAFIAFKQRFFSSPAHPDRYLLSTERQGKQHAITLLSHVILPAIKAGARLPRDFLDFGHTRTDDWFNYFRTLILIPEQSTLPTPLLHSWLVFYIRLLLEARSTSAINVASFKAFISKYRLRLHDRELEIADQLVSPCGPWAIYPRSLQHLCRTVVLRDCCLPGGLQHRQAALRQLQLPGCLEQLLMFAELDLPLKQLDLPDVQQ